MSVNRAPSPSPPFYSISLPPRMTPATQRDSTPYHLLVPLPDCNFSAECEKVLRLIDLKHRITSIPLPSDDLLKLEQDIIQLCQNSCSEVSQQLNNLLQTLQTNSESIPLKPECLQQLIHDLRTIRLCSLYKRSVLGLTAGVHFIESSESVRFVVKWIRPKERISNERYFAALCALDDPHLKMPAWKKLPSNCPIDFFGPPPDAYKKSQSELAVFAHAPGMPLGSFLLNCYSSLSKEEKVQLITLLAKVVFLDALLGNMDRLHKPSSNTPANLGNLLVQKTDAGISVYLIDNMSNLKHNVFPPEQYPGQRIQFLKQFIKQIGIAIAPYYDQISLHQTSSKEKLQSLQQEFQQDVLSQQNTVLSTWEQMSKLLVEKLNCESSYSELLYKATYKQLKRILKSKELLKKIPHRLQDAHFPLSANVPYSDLSPLKMRTIDAWAKVAANVSQRLGAPETTTDLAMLGKEAERIISPSAPTPVTTLVHLIEQMSHESETYHPDFMKLASDAQRVCFTPLS